MASTPNGMRSTDMTYLPGVSKGLFCYLYVAIDLYSKNMVGFEIYNDQSEIIMKSLIQRIVAPLKKIVPNMLYSLNGTAMK